MKNINKLLLLLLLLPVCVYAVKVPGLYEIEVPVADQSEENRKPAIKMALSLVLVKLTGDRFAPGRGSLTPILERSENYMQQYRYKEMPIENPDMPDKNTSELRLWVLFDEETLEKTLRELSVPVWGQERPSTLIWLAVQDEAGRKLLGLDTETNYISVIDKQARLRGVALIYPLLDLEDTSRLRPSDVWGGFKEPILFASSRYRVDSILTGTLESSLSGIWEGQWTAYIDGQAKTWVTEGDIPDAVLDEGIDGMADLLAEKYAGAGLYDEIKGVKIVVADIFNVDQYAQTLKYLKSLNSVTEVQVTNVQAGKVTFMLNVHGGEMAVTQAIALSRILAPISDYEVNAYRLLP